jgi:hypothetical protein
MARENSPSQRKEYTKNTNQLKQRNMKTLSDSEKKEFLKSHLAHRLTLLRTFKERQNWLKDEMNPPNNRRHGDLARCAKDSALISIRLLSGAMALRVLKTPGKSGNFALFDYREKRVKDLRKDDDIWLDDLGGTLPKTDDLTEENKRLLVGVLKRADKELAHLTKTFDNEFNTAKIIVEAIDIIERLINEHLYIKVGVTMPLVDPGIGWNHSFFIDAP